jgi:signal peptidase I
MIFKTYNEKLLVLACSLLILPMAVAADLPQKFVGIWATADSSFDGEFFLGGRAVYLDKNGDGVLLGGPLSPSCTHVSCARPAGMRFRASATSDQTALISTSQDMAGNTISGTGWTHDVATDTLRSEMMSIRGTIFSHRSALVSPEVMETYLVQLRQLEKDKPSGVEAYTVPSHAMEPTLQEKAAVLVDTRVYETSSPERGHIIVYESLKNQGVAYIYRVVAVPGDTVEVKDWTLIVNGKTVEPYAASRKRSMPLSRNMPPVSVPKETVFVIGDNWDNSLDSRFRGVVSRHDIKGKVILQKISEFEGDFMPVK